MRTKKAQVTVFIIIAIVVMVVIGIIYSLRAATSRTSTQTEVTRTAETRLESRPIQVFMDNCLDNIVKDGIILIGKQGGRLSVEQGGTLKRFSHIDDVSYSIYPPSKFINNPYEMGLYGADNLPPLTKEGPQSMQLQLERYISNKIKTCNLSSFEIQGLNITKGEPVPSVTIARDNIDVKLTYLLQVQSASTGAKTELTEFTSSQKIRLGLIYQIAAKLVAKDTSNLTFRIDDPANFKEGMSVEVQRNAFGNDDVITIKDPTSFINGSPYEFKLARYNRQAYAYPIDITDKEFRAGDFLYAENISMDPKAADPDEDSLLTIIYKLITPGDVTQQEQVFGSFVIQNGQPVPSQGVLRATIKCPFSIVRVCAKDESPLEPHCTDIGTVTC